MNILKFKIRVIIIGILVATGGMLIYAGCQGCLKHLWHNIFLLSIGSVSLIGAALLIRHILSIRFWGEESWRD